MIADIGRHITAHRAAVDSVAAMADDIAAVAGRIRDVFAAGGKVISCGNGGSAADAQHFAAELTGRYLTDRPALPAVALNTDTSALTSIANDYGFNHVFSRQLEALGRSGDMLFAISTSGNSANVIRAVEVARGLGIHTVALLGKDGGRLRELADQALVVNADNTARIQEAHILILHLLCEGFEDWPA